MSRINTPILIGMLGLSLGLAGACGSDDVSEAMANSSTSSDVSSGIDSSTDVTSGDQSDGGSSGTVPDFEQAYACIDADFAEVAPLAGPGYDPGAGLLDPIQDTYFVHTTQILVRPDKQAEFQATVGEIVGQLMQSAGLVAVAFASEPNCGFARTLGVWRSEEEMYAFVISGAHAEAMAQTTELSLTGKTTSWSATAAEIPVTWAAAMEKLAAVEPAAVYQ